MSPVTPREAVDAAHAAFGRHQGARALHAKGVLCSGTFTATPAAGELSSALHLQGEPVPCTFRFSNASGHPREPDYVPNLRGLAVKLNLPDGTRTDIVAVTAPVFLARTPDVFVELLEARGAGAKAAVKMAALLVRRPWLGPALLQDLPVMRPLSSYALIRYYGQHAFRWRAPDGMACHVRYTLVPEAGGEPHLGLRKARARGRDYLEEELGERLADAPVRFTLELQLADPEDPVDDPSRPWPQTRTRVSAGTFEIERLGSEREGPGDVLVFDPTRVPAGIELSDDPVLRFRAPAYGESVADRTEAQ